MINHKYPYPMVVVSGGLIKDGHFGDLKDYAGAVSVGLYDKRTYSVATASGNGDTFFIGYSSPHTKDEIMKYFNRAQAPHKSEFFRGKDVIKFEVSNPVRRQGEIVTVGWNGTDSCKSKPCKFECGKTYGLDITLSGSPVFRNWARTLTHKIYVTTPCCDSSDCESGCPSGEIDCGWVYKKFAEQIEKHVELNRTGVKAHYITSDFVATAPTHFDYCLNVCDAGDSSALAAVQTAVNETIVTPAVDACNFDVKMKSRVERVGRRGGVSEYKVTCLEAAPNPFVPATFTAMPDCETCPSGYTFVAGGDTWIAKRTIAPTDVLQTEADQLAYATTLAGVYGGTNPEFLGFSLEGIATVKFIVPQGTCVEAVNADTVQKLGFSEGSCTLDTLPTAIAWTQCGESYRIKRKLCMTLPRTKCDTDRLIELQKSLANNTDNLILSSLVLTPGQDCADKYEVEQWSDCMADVCLGKAVASFKDAGGFAGKRWEDTEDAPGVVDPLKKCGLRITAEIPETYFSDCSLDLNDFVETQPVRIEVGWIVDEITGLFDLCDMCNPNIEKIQYGHSDMQTGEEILREYVKAGAYELYGYDFAEPRLREVLDAPRRNQVNRKSFYKIYYLQFKSDKGNRHNFDQKAEVWEATIMFREDDPNSLVFEQQFGAVLGKFGVTLQERK